MATNLLLINLVGLVLIVAIVWWFWLYKPAELILTETVPLVVVENGVYQPARIKVAADKPVTLQFLRKDPSQCAGEVLFPDFEVAQSLYLDETTPVVLAPMRAGRYPFHCQMQMYRGELVVE